MRSMLTKAHENGDTTANARADRVREKRIELIRELEKLYAVLTTPGFDGTITLEVSAKDGRPGRVKASLTSWGKD